MNKTTGELNAQNAILRRIEIQLRFSAELTARQRDTLRDEVRMALVEQGAPPSSVSCRSGSTELVIAWDLTNNLILGGGIVVTAIVVGFGREIGKSLFEWARNRWKKKGEIENRNEQEFIRLQSKIECEIPNYAGKIEIARHRVQQALQPYLLSDVDMVVHVRYVFEDVPTDREWSVEGILRARHDEPLVIEQEIRERAGISKFKTESSKQA